MTGTGVDEDAYIAPRTDMERELCALWIRLTANDDIGITDRFLDVGGHSLLAAQVVTRIRERYGVTLPLRWCFDHPTVAELAPVILAGRLAQLPAAGELLGEVERG